jgi:hypothetical protein
MSDSRRQLCWCPQSSFNDLILFFENRKEGKMLFFFRPSLDYMWENRKECHFMTRCSSSKATDSMGRILSGSATWYPIILCRVWSITTTRSSSGVSRLKFRELDLRRMSENWPMLPPCCSSLTLPIIDPIFCLLVPVLASRTTEIFKNLSPIGSDCWRTLMWMSRGTFPEWVCQVFFSVRSHAVKLYEIKK